MEKENKLIAEFMGYEDWSEYNSVRLKRTDGIDAYKHICKYKDIKYHTSWDWLMPVVEKIESLGYWVNRNNGDVTISKDNDMIVITPMSSGGIDMMYQAVVEFINGFNCKYRI